MVRRAHLFASGEVSGGLKPLKWICEHPWVVRLLKSQMTGGCSRHKSAERILRPVAGSFSGSRKGIRFISPIQHVH